MSILVCKGTTLEQDISATLTTISQVISFDGPTPDVETFEADYLDEGNVGIPMKPTGRASGGTISFEMFLDPALAGHKELIALIETPVVESWGITFTDTTAWTFDGVFKGLGPAVDMADGLKGSGSIELDGLPTYPALA
ncbi:MAG: hypothetical protein HUJ26_18985 [Planctomycetaceae bacterium]|nr:hypothetical protein [Planctomycetaceae bacterium]